ncbi:histidine utilization repressor [Burkholderia sp. SCN-KJ]|uniref:histidine utilization repressor n=1 Tax=Burkholderia sp. SCN-KJ TaxID=2969248 RepID=UPI00214F83E4|nr:histidine utilization repressor [Burkholderia sp. SCN-KJ]MCR4470188.1 histidine utilization repressor [Burkholderia sp. SCN-KJ]
MNETERQLTARPARASGEAVPARALPAYQQIKRYVVERIAKGDWKPGGAIPTEAELVKEFGVARMTVSRALRELTNERVLTRIQGAGTFVERRHYESTVLEIRNIADEIAERGHRHSARVVLIERSVDPDAIDALGLRSGPVFHSRIVHFEEDEPIQFEDRYVNPALFPDYLEQDFTIETPNHYMVRLAPIQRAEFRIYAEKPNAQVRRHLVMEIGEPCLVLKRRTWVGEHVATSVRLWHPASRFHLAGKM